MLFSIRVFFMKKFLSICTFVLLLGVPLTLLADAEANSLKSVLTEILGWDSQKIKAFTLLFENSEAKPHYEALVKAKHPNTQNEYLFLLNETLQKFWFRDAEENIIQRRFAVLAGKPLSPVKERFQISTVDLAAFDPSKLTAEQLKNYQSLQLFKSCLAQFGVFKGAPASNRKKTEHLILAYLGATFPSAESRAEWGAKFLKSHPELKPEFIALLSGSRPLNQEIDLEAMKAPGYSTQGVTTEFEMMQAIAKKHFANYKGKWIEINVPLRTDGMRPNTTDTFEYAGREINRLIKTGKIGMGQKLTILSLTEAPNFFVQTQQAKTGLIKANAPMDQIILEYTGIGIPSDQQTHSETLILGLSTIAAEVFTVVERQKYLLELESSKKSVSNRSKGRIRPHLTAIVR